jgi:hypothetical protein
MKNESGTSRRQKAHVKEQIEVAFQIPLPDWFVEGATVAQMRRLQILFDEAHQRYMTEAVPTRDPRVEQIP